MLKQSPLRQIVVNAGAAASVRLCVETLNEFKNLLMLDAAASVRLCVETAPIEFFYPVERRSRLRAAVC